MLRLALDTATPYGCVALADGEELLAESVIPVRATGSEVVLPEVERLLAACGHSVAEVEAIVVGAGPGSFTGVRIAASVAKGMAFAGRARLLSYSTLMAIAAGAGAAGRVCAIVDARREQVYAAGYEVSSSSCRQLFAPVAAAAAELGPMLGGAPWCVAGNLPGPVEDALREARCTLLPRYRGIPRASALLWLAAVEPDLGVVEDPRGWEPEYLRPPAALREIEG